jgi:hypothetical protein
LLNLSALLLVGVAACTAAGDAADGERSGGSAGSSDTTPAGGADDELGFGSGSSSSGAGAEPQSCAASSQIAEPASVNLFISFDKSGSMDSDGKWSAATSALKSFFQDPASDGLRVAMRFFGDDMPYGSGCAKGICNLSACAAPHVDVGTLSAAPGDLHELALIHAIDVRVPGGGGGTPIHPALHGATSWAKNHKAQHPADAAVVVLVTDGAPNGCIESPSAIAAVAAEALASADILTYAIGLDGSHESTMNGIATAGGTGQAIFIGNSNVSDELNAALQQIHVDAALPCEYAMPKGDDIDPNKVNVDFTPSGGTGDTIGQVADETGCAGTHGGWYYDNPTAPNRIILCPDSCGAVQNDAGGQMDIVVGCATEAATPK